MKILVTSAEKRATLDNFETGEDPSTTQRVDISFAEGAYDTLEDLANELWVAESKKNWYAFDEGRIICNVMENETGMAASDSDLEKFAKGEIDLWACEYDFRVEFTETHTPSMEELAEKLEIEAYD
jgi:hypothetical protein